MVRLKGKLKGSTLIEVIIALIIISMVSVLSSVFLLQSYSKTNFTYKIKALLILDNEIELSIRNNDFSELEKEIDNYKFERISSDYKLSSGLKKVDFFILNKDKKIIIERHKIISINSEKVTQIK